MIGPNQRKYINALKSGRFRQTTCTLAKGNCYCALGVACMIFGCVRRDYSFDGEAGGAPKRVVESLGLCDCMGSSIDGTSSIMGMNDNMELSFHDIAMVLENNPHNYFKEVK